MPQLRHRAGDLIQERYEVRKLLGSGAFGTVYGCRDAELGIAVAVKEMHVLDAVGGSGERPHALRQFRSEAIHLSRLRHPNIVSGHYEPHQGTWHVCPICGLDFETSTCPDHGTRLLEVTSRHYLVMEYIAGPDLLEAAQRQGGHLPPEEVLAYAREVAAALAHIHARGFVHRDIKPENIRLRLDDHGAISESVLLDFGIATHGQTEAGDKYGTRAQRHTTGGGTVGYAPDSPHERDNPDARSDIHAFGMTFYHLLTGHDPTDPPQNRDMRRHTPADFNPDIGLDVDQLIQDCIHPDPAARPQDGGELLQRLDQLGQLDMEEELEEEEDAADPFQSLIVPVAPAAMGTPNPTVPAPPLPEPFVFRSGAYARDVQGLAQLLDQYPGEGIRHLFAGEIENWLFSIGQEELALEARDIRFRCRNRQTQGLETFLAATGALEPPELTTSPGQLHFGTIKGGRQKSIDLVIQNPGRGHLFGRISASLPAVYSSGEWDGNRARIPITFDAGRLRPGRYGGDVWLHSAAGEFAVPFEARVAGPSWLAPFISVLFFGLAFMLWGALARMAPFYASARPGWGWLDPGEHLNWFPAAPIFALALAVGWLSLVVTESVLRRSLSLFLLLAPLGCILCMGAAILGTEWLPAGDMALKPFAYPWTHGFAAGGWMGAGALLGSAYGAVRRPRDLFSLRILAQLAGILASTGMVLAALFGAGVHTRF